MVFRFLFFFSCFFLSHSLHVIPRSLEGTAYVDDGLSQKQLALLRYFAQLTYIQSNTTNKWDGWGDLTDCDDNTCLRYELASVGYAVALTMSKTTAYSEVSKLILDDVIQRMIDREAWQYVEDFKDYQRQPTYPDPVAYKNIMYSGHLAQLIALYEWFTGDFKYAKTGWDFVWNSTTQFHYTTIDLMDVIFKQIQSEKYGGIACEPDSIFIICNNFPHNAYQLIDKMYGTTYTQSDNLWSSSVSTHGIQRLPFGTGQYFMLDYLIFPGIWEPEASQGSDAWALSWMKLWWPESEMSVLENAFIHMSSSSQWRNDSMGQYLQVEPIGNDIFPFNDAITTSFWPLIEKQFWTNQSQLLGRGEATISWCEGHFGEMYDSDGDGVKESYRYLIPGNYTIFASANLLTGYLFPNGTQPDFLRNLFQSTTPFYKMIQTLPFVSHVDYPNVMVTSAKFFVGENNNNAGGNLTFSIVGGDKKLVEDTTILINNIDSIESITMNGEKFTNYQVGNGEATLQVPPPSMSEETEFVVFV